jgi:CheY-like chemotaxis protein
VTPRSGPLRILVVDDEPAILRFLYASLESQGYIVSTAVNARTALDMVRKKAADLVVLDLGLPDMDGLDVVRQIRDGGETVPIIILSSRDNESAVLQRLGTRLQIGHGNGHKTNPRMQDRDGWRRGSGQSLAAFICSRKHVRPLAMSEWQHIELMSISQRLLPNILHAP